MRPATATDTRSWILGLHTPLRGGEAPSSVIVVCRSRIQDQVAVAVAVGGGGAVAVAVAGLTKRFFNHIQKDFLINVWGYGPPRGDFG